MYSVFTAMSSYVLLSLLIIALILLSLNVWTDQVFSVNGASVSVMCLHITMALPLSVSLVMAESNDLPASSSSGSMDKVKICKLKHTYISNPSSYSQSETPNWFWSDRENRCYCFLCLWVPPISQWHGCTFLSVSKIFFVWSKCIKVNFTKRVDASSDFTTFRPGKTSWLSSSSSSCQAWCSWLASSFWSWVEQSGLEEPRRISFIFFGGFPHYLTN